MRNSSQWKTRALGVYRWVQRAWVEKWVLPHFFSPKRVPVCRASLQAPLSEPSLREKKRIWFHAASAGELECLWPLILQLAKSQVALGVSIFSESAWPSLPKLRSELEAQSATVCFLGFSPWEGSWSQALDQFQPHLWITAKYEAWPDLWASLAERKIPLIIVGARPRRSLSLAKMISQRLFGRLPECLFFPTDESDVAGLKRIFPQASLHCVNEPRWERVFERAEKGNPRAREIGLAFEEFSSSLGCGVIGNAWISDLQFLSELIGHESSLLWVVPHRVDSATVATLDAWIQSLGRSVIQTQGRSEQELKHEFLKAWGSPDARSKTLPPVILVNEMGFLLELYSKAQWAYVGGGFGHGVHSTLEPAIFGIPVASGPQGQHKFSEIQQLQKTQQLRVLKNQADLRYWMKSRNSSSLERETWIQQAQNRRGGVNQIARVLEKRYF
ncbi:MAG: glycosyltransferase N-terminal domain-containing protein [Bdellovibrionia bacterium]